MTPTLTERTKVLLILLIALLLAVCYYYAVQIPVSDRIQTAQEAGASALDEITIDTLKAEKMKKMQDVIDSAAQNSSSKAEIPVYDNLEQVMIQLDSILKTTIDYSLTFDQLTINDHLVYRPIKMSFTCAGYSAAKAILESLNNCPYRCTLDDISVSTVSSSDSDLLSSDITVNLMITFIEKTN